MSAQRPTCVNCRSRKKHLTMYGDLGFCSETCVGDYEAKLSDQCDHLMTVLTTLRREMGKGRR